MATEDFTTYIKVDPNSRFTVTASTVTWTNLTRNEAAYIYKDKGVGVIAGNFIHNLDFVLSSIDTNNYQIIWRLDNNIGTQQSGIVMVVGQSGGMYFSDYTNNSSSFTPTLGTTYYLTVKRDTSAGSNGKVYIYIFSDSSRATLVAQLTLVLAANNNFRYIYAIQGVNNGNTDKQTGSIANLDLSAGQPNPTISPAAGSYSLSGKTLTMTKVLTVSLVKGTYSLTGRAVTLGLGHLLTIASGAYSLSGKAVTFTKALGVSLTRGTYTLTGYSVTFIKNLVITLTRGVYTLTGFTLTFWGWIKRVRPSLGSWIKRTRPSLGTWTKRTKPPYR